MGEMESDSFDARPDNIIKHTEAEIVNGDPYVAVLMADPADQDATPIEKETILLGSGFGSADAIANYINRLLEDPEQRADAGITFQPSSCHVFELAMEFTFTE